MWKSDAITVLLAAISPLLREFDEWDCIVIPEVTVADLNLLIEYMYTGRYDS